MIENPEIERFCLAGLLRYPRIFPEVHNILTEQDFRDKLNRAVFSSIRFFATKGDTELSEFLVGERIKQLNIRFNVNGLDPIEYVETLKQIQITEKGAMEFMVRLKQVTVRREISETAKKIQETMRDSKDADISEIVRMADLLYTEKISQFEISAEFPNIFESLETRIEERGNNPLDEIGLMGPFQTVNALYGSLLRDGAITVLGARTGIGKTTMGLYYMTWVAEKYGLPILHLDQGEMSIEELQLRAMSMFTGGKVSYDALERGYWRKNAEATSLVRSVWPRVQKLKMFYHDVSNLSRQQIVSLIRRFYWSKVGRNNKFLSHYDYLKAFDMDDTGAPEWQVMGMFLKDIKNLYKNELANSFWTSIQLNRSGITNNKTAATIDDSENTFGVSDRVTQQSTHSILMRPKLMEEIADENNRFGNTKALFLKKRHLGEKAHQALAPVKTPKGNFANNFVHFKINGFHIEELGDYATTVSQAGQLAQHHHAPSDSDALLQDPDLAP